MNIFSYQKQIQRLLPADNSAGGKNNFSENSFPARKEPAFRIKSAVAILLYSVICSVFFISCSYPNACYNNLKGVFAFENGNFGQALINYRKAASEAEEKSEYVYYNISRLYRDMGENSASSGILDSLTGVSDKKLEYRINFLKAVIAYNDGRFDDAVLFYKNSIKIDNSDIELLKGLELSFKQLENRKSGKNNKRGTSGSSADNGSADSEKRDGGTYTGDRSVSEDVLDLLFTEEVILCPVKGDVEQKNTPDW